jgi:hypothetical protein
MQEEELPQFIGCAEQFYYLVEKFGIEAVVRPEINRCEQQDSSLFTESAISSHSRSERDLV